MISKENSYACGKEIPRTEVPSEVYNLYKLGLNKSLNNRSEYQFIFSWNYNRLSEEGKDEVCRMIKEGV